VVTYLAPDRSGTGAGGQNWLLTTLIGHYHIMTYVNFVMQHKVGQKLVKELNTANGKGRDSLR
jgi:hypothetical protein